LTIVGWVDIFIEGRTINIGIPHFQFTLWRIVEVSFPRSAWECSWWRFASQKFKLFTTFSSKWRMPFLIVYPLIRYTIGTEAYYVKMITKFEKNNSEFPN